MKGIAGIVYPDVFQVEHLIFPMLDVINRSKSVKRDIHTYNNIQIGTTKDKLAFNEKKNIVVSFSGVIYNQEHLKQELHKHGYRLLTLDPAELIVHAYEIWKNKFLEKIDGDFSLAILDIEHKRIILARDRIGKYPLYWFHNNNHFVFASELKAMLATGIIPQAPSNDALASYFHFGYLPQDLTPIQGVCKLLPGHYLTYHFNQSKTIEPYWSYSFFFQNPVHKHKNTIAKTLNSYLEESVAKRCQGIENPGCIVSGGLGSASVSYYIRKYYKNQNLNSFSVAFEGENNQDVEIASQVAESVGLQKNIFFITPNQFLDDLVKIIWHLDEPISDPNIISTWFLGKMASQKTKYLFSGMGSDELLAGHTRYHLKEQNVSLLTKLFQLPKAHICHFLVPIVNIFSSSLAYRMLKKCRRNPWQYEYLRANSLFNDKYLKKASPKLAGLFDPEVFLHKFHHLSRINSTLASFLYFDIKTRLADCFIHQYERITQAYNLSWNSPFLDQKLIEFLATLATPEFLEQNESENSLKMIMNTILPKTVLQRPKVTRKNMLSTWINHPKIFPCFEKLKHGTLIETGLVSENWLKHVLQSPKKRIENFRFLWAILTLEIWFQLMINRPITFIEPDMSVMQLQNSK